MRGLLSVGATILRGLVALGRRAAPKAWELAAYGLFVRAAWLVRPALALAVAGVACLVISQGLEGEALFRRFRGRRPGGQS